jgi:hypothetical protein
MLALDLTLTALCSALFHVIRSSQFCLELGRTSEVRERCEILTQKIILNVPYSSTKKIIANSQRVQVGYHDCDTHKGILQVHTPLHLTVSDEQLIQLKRQ